MAVKCQRARRKINLSNKEKKSYKSNTGNKMDRNQAIDKYLLQFWEAKKKTL